MKKLIISSVMILTLFACAKNTFKIDVEMTNANGKLVYLQKIIDNEFVNIDSVLITDNKAHFDVKKEDNSDVYHIFIKGWRRALPFFPDNEDIIINGDFNNYNKIAISAATTQQYLDSIIKVLNNSNDIKKNEIITSLTKDDNLGPHRNVAPYLIYRYKWLFTLDELREFVTYFDNEQTSYLGEIKEYINLMERTEVGQPYIDFTMDNVEGEIITLSDLIGNNKLLMIDFWAAWCPDCRAENPNIVAVYNDFKDKGLDIISVSLDTDKNAWTKAIADDDLSWKNHVSELKGWDCSAATEYGVAWIPQNFLIDIDGNIVAKSLNGNDLRIFVENYLK
ncbi:MAG: AhpC/TSA family protein [Bacteroidales bacterium]|nr:AhpC/TSA family protein [Bacteroidales bacterium]